MGSAGSVIPLFERQISEQGKVTLTDERMSRFFISIQSASQLLIEISKRAVDEELITNNEKEYLYRFTDNLFVISKDDHHGWRTEL